MNVLYISFLCVAPFIFYLFLGYISKVFLKTRNETFIDLNKVAFHFFLPTSLFFNVYEANFTNIDASLPILISLVGIMLIFFISTISYGLRKMENGDKSVMIQSTFRSNIILFGIPLVTNILQNNITALSGIIISLAVPLFNILAIIVLSIYSNRKKSILQILFSIFKNPLIIAAIAGFALKSADISIPEFLVSISKTLALMATPIALFALGGRFSFTITKTHMKYLYESLFLRLLLIPAIFTGISIYFGLRGEALALMLALFGGPVAVTSYTMAQQMNANEKLAGQILVYSTLLSNFTLFLFISLFKYLQFF